MMTVRNEKNGPGLKVISSWDKIGHIEDIEIGAENNCVNPPPRG